MTELIKVQPRPDHFHREDQVVCERCLSRIASSGCFAIDVLQEQTYLFCKLVEIGLDAAKSSLDKLCTFAKAKCERVDIAECIYLSFQAIRLVLEPFAILIYAVSLVIIGMCNPETRKKTPYEIREEKLTKLFNEYKDRNFEAHKLHIDADRTPHAWKEEEYRKRADEEDALAKIALSKYWKT